MNKKLRSLIFYVVTSLVCSLTYGQQQEEQQPLAQILLEIENKYDVKFSFETKTIEGILITSLPPNFNLDQVINQLKLITNLNFEILSKRFIAVTLKSNSDSENAIQQLEEVVVTNYLTKGISKTNNGTIEADTKDFQILPGLIAPDVLQIAQKLPGIISVDERISNINVRGGTNDQNLILFEGIRMYQTGHFFGLISAFNPYLSDNFTVFKNGTSAKYGNAVSSTITIRNSNDIKEKTNVGIGSNLLSVDGYTTIPLSKKMALQLAARRSFTDLLVSNTYDSYFERIFKDSELNSSNNKTQLALDERFLFHDFNAKLLYDIDASSKLRVNLINMYNNLNYNQVFTTTNNNFQSTESKLNQESFGLSTTYANVLKNDVNLSTELYFSKYDLYARNNDITNNQIVKQENKVEDYGARLDISKVVSPSLKINLGYQFNEIAVTNSEDIINPDFMSITKEIIRTHALFGEVVRFSKSRNTYFRLGARVNYFNQLKALIIEPRFAFNQKLSESFRLEILGELKSQTVSQIIDLQQDFLGIEKRRWQLANGRNLPIIKSQQVSAGLIYNQNDLLVTIESYYKNVSNITAQSQGFQNQFQFTNDIGSYTVIGFDFLINKRIKNFSTWVSYSFSKNDYHFENLNKGHSFANTLDLQHVVNASLIYNLSNFKLGLGFNWHSGKPYTTPTSQQDNNNSIIEYNSPNHSRLPDYFRTDISAIYNFRISNKVKANVGASVWNVFNHTNVVNRYYTNDSEDSLIKNDNRSLKFTPNVSFRLSF
ncbi:FecR domain-containing protein [Winogradskyella bathintestinalis]|uniref:TonB-dependent receptor plug domain-containing protein n=1 Tax=Winogradskyella bathintestinalis TaxID=3035208 RepID=A0ABT7ZUC8_9FLAO|nr:FecR domain-containing protein [Winogradskyella bathintestinalis]MDN3492615.1 TonB-dependent receptor plug domain-containing protein [Winogradskyella bathintestinalis]